MRTGFDKDDVIKMLEDIKSAQCNEDSGICNHNYNCPKEYVYSDGTHDCTNCAINTFINVLKEGDHDILEYFFKNDDYPNNIYGNKEKNND